MTSWSLTFYALIHMKGSMKAVSRNNWEWVSSAIAQVSSKEFGLDAMTDLHASINFRRNKWSIMSTFHNRRSGFCGKCRWMWSYCLCISQFLTLKCPLVQFTTNNQVVLRRYLLMNINTILPLILVICSVGTISCPVPGRDFQRHEIFQNWSHNITRI